MLSFSQPKNRHASPNHHRPTTMLHSLMDMLRSNTFFIFNPISWLTIWSNLFIFVSSLKITHFQSSMVQFAYLWANHMHARTCLRLRNGFLCCTCAPNPASLKARLTMMSNNNLHVSNRSCFVVTNAIPSQPSVPRVAQHLFSRPARSFGRPPLCLSISPPYILPQMHYKRLAHTH
jgi:hypothetical protein